MLHELPFFLIDDNVLEKVLNIVKCKTVLNDRLADQGLRDYLFTVSKQKYFKTLNSSYYTTENFNSKFRKYKFNIALSIFHLNIRCLNANHRGLQLLLDLLQIEFDILILSEI